MNDGSPKVVLAGFGNVGREFVRVLTEKKDFLRERFGISPLLAGVLTRSRGGIYNPRGLSRDSLEGWYGSRRYSAREDTEQVLGDASTEDLLDSLDYDILVECTRNDFEKGQPGATYIEKALQRGAHVLTTNRGALAYHYHHLQQVARSHKRWLRYEGTVLSGIPLFSLWKSCLQGAEVLAFEGALSATCNYMLHVMARGASFDDALMEAQRKGYTEPDPRLDIDGLESALKGLILAQELTPEASPMKCTTVIEGIRQVTPSFLETARRKGGVVKLVTRLLWDARGCTVHVAPEMLPLTHPLASIEGVTCGAFLTTDLHGELCLTGAGAGGGSTVAAMLNDLISIVLEEPFRGSF